jgi:predicted LPLAT superfamily acyltransferase
MWLIVTITLRAGRPIGRAFLYPICAYFLAFSGGARRASFDYLTRVLGRRPGWSERFRHYHCFAGQILDRVSLLNGELQKFDCAIHGLEALDAALAKRCGVLLVGAHLGSFDVMRVLAQERSKMRLRVLMHEANAEKMSSVFASLNLQIPHQVIALGRPATMLEVREALASGEIIGMLADRVVAGDRVRYCPFLGGSAPFAEGPFALAKVLRVPVVLFSAIQSDKRRYEIKFESFEEGPFPSRAKRDAALQDACQRYASWLEARCREAPFNWFNFYDFWGAAAPVENN